MDKLVIPRDCIIQGDRVTIRYEGDIQIENDLVPLSVKSNSGGIRFVPQGKSLTCSHLSCENGLLSVEADLLSAEFLSANHVELKLGELEISQALQVNESADIRAKTVNIDEVFADTLVVEGEDSVTIQAIEANQVSMQVGKGSIRHIRAKNVVIEAVGRFECDKITAEQSVEVRSGEIGVKFLESPTFIAAPEVQGIVMLATCEEVKAEGVRGFIRPDEFRMLAETGPFAALVSGETGEAEEGQSVDIVELAQSEPNENVEQATTLDLEEVLEQEPDSGEAEPDRDEAEPESTILEESASETESEESEMDAEPTAAIEDQEHEQFREAESEQAEEEQPGPDDRNTVSMDEEPIVEPEQAPEPTGEAVDAENLEQSGVSVMPSEVAEETEQIEDPYMTREIHDLDPELFGFQQKRVVKEREDDLASDLDDAEAAAEGTELDEEPIPETTPETDQEPIELDDEDDLMDIDMPDEEIDALPEITDFDDFVELSDDDMRSEPLPEDAINDDEQNLLEDHVDEVRDDSIESEADDREDISMDNELEEAIEDSIDNVLDHSMDIPEADSVEVEEGFGSDEEATEDEDDDVVLEISNDENELDVEIEEEPVGSEAEPSLEDEQSELDQEDDSNPPPTPPPVTTVQPPSPPPVPASEESEAGLDALVMELYGLLDQIRSFFPDENYPKFINQIQTYLEERRFNILRKARNRDAVLNSFDRLQHPDISACARQFYSVMARHFGDPEDFE